MPNVTPASPDAASLGKYGEWPVSQYTGLPSVTIPLYSIKVGGFELPIQLSYHAGGVKVDDVSSSVGVNWSLNAGGVITRTVVGLPDEAVPGGFLYRSQRGTLLKQSYSYSDINDFIFFRQVGDKLVDTDPDIFQFNFSGFSGKFYFDETGNFHSIPENNLKLIFSPVNNTLNGTTDQHWEIADGDGNIFHFGSVAADNGIEKTTVFEMSPSVSEMYITGWYLTKIVLANNVDTIFLDYASKAESYDLPANQSLRVLSSSISFPSASGSWEESLNCDVLLTNGKAPSQIQTGMSFSASGSALLSKIKWRFGEVVFNHTTSRQDIQGKLLDGITVNNKNGQKVKDFKFAYALEKLRYYLESVKEYGSDLSASIEHKFEYYDRASLPIRTGSNAQDHWGFFNAYSNTNLLPAQPGITNFNLNANREVNELVFHYGSLKRIIYPTGGFTEFEYESHRYDPASPVGGGNPLSQIISATKTARAGDPQPAGYSRIESFTVPFAQSYRPLNIEFTNYNKPVSKEQAWLPSVRIEKLVGTTYQTVSYWDAFDNFPTYGVTPNANGLVDFTINEYVHLEAGEYRIVSDLSCGNSNCGTPSVKPQGSVQISYQTYNGSLPLAGGLRIKRIKSYANDKFAFSKKFVYDPGKLLIYPRYLHQYGENVYHLAAQDPRDLCVTVFAKYKEVTSSSQTILGFTQGATVGYTSVQEVDEDATGKDKGFIVYKFTFTSDVRNEFSYDNTYWSGIDILNTSCPLNSFEYKRGMLESKIIYGKSTDGTYIKLQSESHTYNFNDNNAGNKYHTLRGMRVKRMRSVNYPCGTLSNGYMVPQGFSTAASPDFAYSFYQYITSWVQKTSTTITQYDEKGLNPQVSTVSYTYSNPAHMQITSTSTTNSEGNVLRTDLKYCADFAAGTNAIADGMRSRNMLNKVIEGKSFTNNILTFTRENAYDFYSGNTQIFLKEIKTSLEGNPLLTELTYSYDTRGNILSMAPKSGLNKTLLWANSGEYLKAEVVNCQSNEAFFESFEDNISWLKVTNDNTRSRAGKYSAKITKLTTGELITYSPSWLNVALIQPTKYSFSGWVYTTGPSVDLALVMKKTGEVASYTYINTLTTSVLNQWVFLQGEFQVPADAAQIGLRLDNNGGGTVWFDDLRIHPVGALMTSYTYEPLIGMSSATNATQNSVHYQFDSLGRLIVVRNKDKNVLKKIKYSFSALEHSAQ